jgi:glutamate racemase
VTHWLKDRFRLGAIWLAIVLLIPSPSLRSQDDVAALQKSLKSKASVTIVVTDSGLGGLSVVAGIEKRCRSSRTFKKVRLVFVNAMPTAKKGYNKMTPAEKVSVFNDALGAMNRRFKPDAILIACNTLSVVYPDTPFARTAAIPVVGIVGLGIDMIAEALGRAPKGIAVIYGTETTIESNSHRDGLLKRGILPERIVSVPCSGLAIKIQNDVNSEAVKTAIAGFVRDGMAALPTPGPRVVVGLCCTHYGYSSTLFSSCTVEAGASAVEILNPNDRMSELLFKGRPKRTYPLVKTSVDVYSRGELSVEARKNIADLVRPASLKTAEALLGYTHDPELWPYPGPAAPQ